MERHVVISLSGGMDSSTLLLRCLKEYDTVTAISFDYGQKHRVELDRAQSLVDYVNANPNRVFVHEELPNGFISYPQVNYRVITLDGLTDLLNSALVTGGDEVPEGHYAEENMKATVVPNRNKIFSSIIQSVALSIANEKQTNVEIAMGIHAGDHSIYPDCRQEFRDVDYDAFVAGNWDADRVRYYTPYLHTDKAGILEDGLKCCEYLHLNFDKVYANTNTSYKPLKHKIEYNNATETWFEEEWFSDYKSASSVERVEAFMKLGRKDPVAYADEHGPVNWEYVVEQVTKTLNNHEASRS